MAMLAPAIQAVAAWPCHADAAAQPSQPRRRRAQQVQKFQVRGNKNNEKPWEIMGKHGKTMGNHGKTRMLMKVYRCSMPLWISTETPDFFVEETCWMFSCRRGEDIWQVREPWWLLAEPGRWGTGAAFGIPTL